MFERYNEDARRALFYSRYEASQLGSISIEPEHLLLGLLRLEPNVASPFLARVPDIRSAVAARVQTKAKISTSVEIPFSKPAKRALEAAAEESDRFRHSHIGPEHLLLALLADPSTIAGDLLTRNGLRLDAVREQIAERPAADRPGPLATGANASPKLRRQAALQQIEAAVEFIKAFGEAHAQTEEARRLIEQICRDIESLERHLPKGES
jgi:ATP-dependent Clp protease ATP-binding subunit ClpC